MSDKKCIDKQYLLESLRDFDKEILSKKYANGNTPYIGDNGNWFIGDTDSGVNAKGQDGEPGNSASVIENQNNTEDYYRLDITNGQENFTTPNLMGVIGMEYKNKSVGTPVGEIIALMGTKVPPNDLACDGTEYSIADYPYLTKYFTDNFGSVNFFGGDGTATFAVPDLRGEFLRGTGENSHRNDILNTLEGAGGNVGEHQSATVTSQASTNNSSWVGFSSVTDGQGNAWYLDAFLNVNRTLYWNSPAIDATPHSIFTTRPTNTSVLWCIKYQPTYWITPTNENYGETSLDIDNIIDGLNDRNYLDGLASETFVGTEITRNIDTHTEIMKNEICKGYQKLLDEDIAYVNAFVVDNSQNIYTSGQKLTFKSLLSDNLGNSIFKSNKITIDSDGYIELKAGHLYLMNPFCMIYVSSSSNNIGYRVIDKNERDITRDKTYTGFQCMHFSHANQYYSDMSPSFYYKPEEDCAICIQIYPDNGIGKMYAYGMTIHEIKQPVVNNIDSESYSYTEKVVGTWVNGKPLYEKTVKIVYGENTNFDGNMGAYRFLEGDIDFLNASNCVITYKNNFNILGPTGSNISVTQDTGLCFASGNSSNTNTFGCAIPGSPGHSYVGVYFGSLASQNGVAYVKLQYTKTNDIVPS